MFPAEASVSPLIQNTPLERILLETDSPFITPVPFRGKRNEPAFMIHTAKRIGEIKDVVVDYNDPDRLIVGYNKTDFTGKSVFLSNDGNNSWEDITGDLPLIDVNAVAIDPTVPETIYVGIGVGVPLSPVPNPQATLAVSTNTRDSAHLVMLLIVPVVL